VIDKRPATTKIHFSWNLKIAAERQCSEAVVWEEFDWSPEVVAIDPFELFNFIECSSISQWNRLLDMILSR